MSIYKLVKQLIDLTGDFADNRSEEQIDLQLFSDWLAKKLDTTISSEKYEITGYSVEAEIAAYIGRLSRYSNTYIKTAMTDLPFTTDMDFAFTAILHRSGPIGKTDLIKKMAYEKSSGMEVIKRLLKNGLIEQFQNPNDKRSKLLRLTSKGEKNINKAYPKASKAARTVSGCLSNNEQIALLKMLKKLDAFHVPIYLNEEKDPDQIIDKYSL